MRIFSVKNAISRPQRNWIWGRELRKVALFRKWFSLNNDTEVSIFYVTCSQDPEPEVVEGDVHQVHPNLRHFVKLPEK